MKTSLINKINELSSFTPYLAPEGETALWKSDVIQAITELDTDSPPQGDVEIAESISTRLAQHATFERHDGIVLGGIEVTHWEHNVKELIYDGIIEALQSSAKEFDEKDLREAFEQGKDFQNIPSKYFDFPEWLDNYRKRSNQ